MDSAEALQTILRKLAVKRTELEGKIETDTLEREGLQRQVAVQEARIAQLDASLAIADAEFKKLDDTISQTEDGYQRILDTAQTLMDIVQQNMPVLEGIDVAPLAQNAECD